MFNLDSSLGIEIRENRLALAAVAKKGFQDYSLKDHLIIENYSALPESELYAQIRQFVRSNGFNRENVIIGLPRSQVVVREIDLPIEVEENLDQVIKSQIERLEPSEEEASCFDYLVAERNESTRRIRIQIVMARKQLVEAYLALLENVDLFPAAVRFSSVGLQNILCAHKNGLPKKDPALMLRLEEGELEVIVLLASGQIRSSSVLLSSEEATVDRLLGEVGQLLSSMESSVTEFSNLYLLGKASDRVRDELRERISECEILTTNLQVGHKGTSREKLADLLTAIGLAISGTSKLKATRFNLVPPDRRMVITKPSLVATYILAGMLLLLFCGFATHEYFQKKSLLAEINAQIASLENEANQVLELRSRNEALRTEFEELNQLMGGRQKTLLILKDLTERLPDSTYLQTLQFQTDHVTMQGYSDQASTLLPVLMESPYLGDVKTNWITQDPRAGGKERFNFGASIK